MPGPEREVFANEMGGNPRVWETADGYRLSYRYQPGRLRRWQEWALRAGLSSAGLILAEIVTAYLPWPLHMPFIWGAAGSMAGLYLANCVVLSLPPLLTQQFHMVFGPTGIRWFGHDAPGGQILCDADHRPEVTIERDEVEMLRMRRKIAKSKVRGEPDNAVKVVLYGDSYGLRSQTILSITAPDPIEQMTRLVAAIRFLIECMGERAMEADRAE